MADNPPDFVPNTRTFPELPPYFMPRLNELLRELHAQDDGGFKTPIFEVELRSNDGAWRREASFFTRKAAEAFRAGLVPSVESRLFVDSGAGHPEWALIHELLRRLEVSP